MILFYFKNWYNKDKHFFIKAKNEKEAKAILKRKYFFTHKDYLILCSIKDNSINRKKYLQDNIILND